MASQDTPQRCTFPLITLDMAVLIGWQFLSAIAHYGLDSAWRFSGPAQTLACSDCAGGMRLLGANLAIVLAVNLLAKLGRLGLYALLFAVRRCSLPSMSGRAFELSASR